VYKCLLNKEIRSANTLDISQDVIKNQHKNKAKTKPKQTQFKANLWHGHPFDKLRAGFGRVFMGWKPMPHLLRTGYLAPGLVPEVKKMQNKANIKIGNLT